MITPLRMLAAALIAFAVIVFLLKTALLPRWMTLVLALFLWAAFRWISLRTSRETRARHAQDIEDLKRKPVLNLNDE